MFTSAWLHTPTLMRSNQVNAKSLYDQPWSGQKFKSDARLTSSLLKAMRASVQHIHRPNEAPPARRHTPIAERYRKQQRMHQQLSLGRTAPAIGTNSAMAVLRCFGTVTTALHDDDGDLRMGGNVATDRRPLHPSVVAEGSWFGWGGVSS